MKNSRRSKNSPERYVEHCIAKFKKDSSKNNIRIAGTLSHYLWVDSILSSKSDIDIIFIGETNKGKLNQMACVT